MGKGEEQELIEANERLIKKQEERKAMGMNTPLMENIKEPFDEVIDRVRKLANETGKTQHVRHPDNDLIIVAFEPDLLKYKRWGIPKLYIDCSFETFKGNDKIVDAIKKAIEIKRDIVLIGNTGCGKTHLAIAAIKMCKESDYGKTFISTQEVLLDIRESFRNNSKESESEVIDRYTKCGVLVLDDLGAEKTSEYSITTLYLIIDRRLRNCKPTIITTNLTLGEIEEKLNARIASRLSSMKVFKINMPDYRKKR